MKLLLKAAVSIGLIALIASQLDLRPVRAALERVDAAGLALGVAIVAIAVAALSALRWLVICRALGVAAGFRRSLELVYVGWFFNQLLPSGVGGDVVRAWRTRDLGADWESAVHCALLDRMLALAAMIVIVAAGWPIVSAVVPSREAQIAIGAALAGSILLLGLLLVADRLQPLQRWPALARMLRISASARKVLAGRFWLAAMAVSAATHVATALCAWVIGRSIGIELAFGAYCVLIPLVLLITMLPVSIGGWGVREGAMIAVFRLAGVEPSAAFALSLLFGLCFVVGGVPGALLWLRKPVRE